MTATDDRKDDDIALAGEYALHLLDSDARHAFDTRLKTEPDLRVLLAEWQEHFASLAAEIPVVAPPQRLKAAIEKRLFSEGSRLKRTWSWPFGWFGGALAGLALFMAFFLILPLDDPNRSSPEYVAEITADDRSLIVAAHYDPASGTLMLQRLAGAPAPNRVFELWLIAEGKTTPISIGVMPNDDATEFALPQSVVALLSGGTLAISDEPSGGSPTGQPTGAVLGHGTLSVLTGA